MAITPATFTETHRGRIEERDASGARKIKTVKVPLVASDTAGALLTWLNPEGVDIIIQHLKVDVTTAATGAGTADFGVAATAISNDSLIDGVDMNAAASVRNSIKNAGSNGVSNVKCLAGYYVTGSKASGNMAGVVGFAYITYQLV